MDWQNEWDSRKRETNFRLHGIDFVDVCGLFGTEMLVRTDSRKDYGEARYIGMAPFKDRLVVVVLTHRGEQSIRIISARKANQREQKIYSKARADQLEEAGRDDRR